MNTYSTRPTVHQLFNIGRLWANWNYFSRDYKDTKVSLDHFSYAIMWMLTVNFHWGQFRIALNDK